MNSYGINIDFVVNITAESYEEALKILNSKYYVKDAEVCNFMNIPVDNVDVYPSEETEMKLFTKEWK